MALSTLTVALGFVGTLLAPVTLRPTQFVSLLLIGGFVGAFVAMLARSISEDRALDSREALVEGGRHAVVGAVWAVAAGVVVLSLGSDGWAVIVATGASYPLVRWLVRRLRRPGRGLDASAEGRQRLRTPPFEKCTTSELAAAWAASYDLLQTTSSARVKARIVALRGAYLDELERRDRRGVLRWLSSGADPASDAAEYFHSPGDGDETRPDVA